MQWNARSVVSNKGSLVKYLYDHDIDVALISETWLKPSRHIFIFWLSRRTQGQSGNTY